MPDRPEWIHEIKHNGYRLIVQRDGNRVRLWTRNGHDWSDRFPLISEAALRNRNSLFVHKCSHHVEISADRWPDHVRLSDIEDRFVCRVCGKRGADIRPDFPQGRMGTG